MKYTLVLCLICVLCGGFDFQTGTAITMEGFRTQGRGENGSLWLLTGARAVIRGALYELRDVTLVMHAEDGAKTTIRSPACTYKQDSGLIESDAPVTVSGDELLLSGVGYDVLLHEKRIRIRNNVEMQVRGVSSKTLIGRELGPAEQAP